MAGVEIDADRLADRVAQSEKCADIVDVLMAVQFETELPDAEALGIGDELPPIRDQHVLPLIARSMACVSGGQLVVTQLALASPGPPGQPDIMTTRSIPSRPARAIVFFVTARWRAPGSPGWSGLPEQLSALMAMPWSLTAAVNSLRAAPLSSMR